MNGIQKVKKNLIYSTRTFLGSNRISFPLLYLFPSFNEKLPKKNTTICIEGFPRCANSFSYNAFMKWNPQAEAVVHHTHVPQSIWSSYRAGIPCILVIRPPLDALSSLLIVDRALSVDIAIKSYIQFHEEVLPIADQIVVSDFKKTVECFDEAIQAVNAKYGTHFKSETITSELRDEIFQTLTEVNVRFEQPKNLVAIPTPEKQRLKKSVAEELKAMPSLSKAQAIYESIEAHSI